ncbi:MAG: tetratricopeptide repeat protein [Acetivibrio sp.]
MIKKKNEKSGWKILLSLIIIILITGCSAEKKAKESYKEGLSSLEKTEYSEAIENFNHSLIKDGDRKKEREINKKAYYGLGVSYFEQGEYKKAETNLKKALKIEELPDWNYDIQNYLLDTLIRLEQQEEAYDLVQIVRKEKPKDFTLIFKEYDILKELDKEEEAVSLLNEALSIKGLDRENQYMRARAYYYLGNTKKAQAGMEKAIKKDIPEAMFYMGKIEEDKGKYEEALSWYDRYQKAEKKVSDVLYLQEMACYNKLGKPKDALFTVRDGILNGDGSCLRELKYSEIVLLEKELSFQEAYDKCSDYVKNYEEDEIMKKEFEFLKTRTKN